MKLGLMAVFGLGAGLVTAQVSAQSPVTLKDQKDKVSYSIGLNIGNTLKQQSLDLNTDTLAAGIKDALAGGKTLLTEEQVKETLMAFQKEMMAKQMEKGAKAKEDGDKFLAENKKKVGVKSLTRGLQYQVITEGKGKKPKSTDTVKTHYRGTLIDGTEFDSSYKAGEPVSFPVTGVIPGWTEALQQMPVGSKWKLFIPSELAYGEQGQGPIPPNSALIFEIELLGIEEPPKAAK
jgi:FKBP-type peptidyl-prolyl cis-trans isomerase